MAGRTAFHSPRSLAWTCWLAEASSTVTFSLGCAQPQITSGFSCCNTMWLENTFGSRTSACAVRMNPLPPASATITGHIAQPSRLFRIMVSF